MALYGDLMTALTYSLFIPLYLRSYMMESVPPRASLIIFFELSACILHWIAWAKDHRRFSVLAFIVQCGCFTTNTIYKWPFGDDPTLLPQFLWAVTIHTSSNMSLSAPVKIAMIYYALAWAIVSIIMTPSLETLPTIATCVVAAMLASAIHIRRWLSLSDESFSARLAAMILCAVFVHHLATEVNRIMQIPGYGATGGYNITKMGIVASMGIVATGAFRDQVSIKQSLQSLVQSKGNEMARQAETMEMISLAVEASETAIAITDADHNIIWSNHALQRLIGLAADEVKSNPLIKSMNLAESDALNFHSCFGTMQKAMEVRMDGKDIRLVVSPFTSSTGSSNGSDAKRNDPIRFLVAMNDVSQLRARERAEKAAEQAARTAMQESMETLTHELRTPLQGIIGMTSLVLDSNHTSAEETYQCMNTVMASSRLLLTLINNLLDSHKLDANMMDAFQLVPIPLAAAMRDTANFCRPIAALNDTDPHLCLDFDESDNVVVRSNPVRFQQVLVNLVSNAIKYAGKGTINLRAEVVSVEEAQGRIEKSLAKGVDDVIITSPTSKVAIISVEDSGDGIPAEMVDRVFQKFSQYCNPNKTYTRSGCLNAHASGTGIGLNLCRKFVQRMDGNIWVTNKPYGGACFSFCLPIMPSTDVKVVHPEWSLICPVDVDSQHLSEEKSDAALGAHHQALKVLVVDDTLINLKVLERMIKRLSGVYSVTAADSGAKALKELSREPYDLVITDIQMPLMDGIELCKAIREADTIQPKPVVAALTAETSETLHNRCSAAGISHILHKPISSHQFKSFFDCTLRNLTPCDTAYQ